MRILNIIREFVACCLIVLGFVTSVCAEQSDLKLQEDGILYNQALYARNEGDAEKTLQLLKEITIKYPEGKYVSSAYYELALLEKKKGNSDPALEFAEKSVKYDKNQKVIDKALFLIGELCREAGDYKSALDAYLTIIEKYPYAETIGKAVQKRDEMNMKILYSKDIDTYGIMYEVRPGDSLHKIAKKYGTTVELIKKCNRLEGDIIRPGMTLKIVKGEFDVLIDKSQKILFLKMDGNVFKAYRIAVGREGITPEGEFQIINKLENPTWYYNGREIPYGDPDNLLGARWIGINKQGYGIHGTTEKLDITKQTTSGCVRMTNEEVRELYDIVTIGVPVVIVN